MEIYEGLTELMQSVKQGLMLDLFDEPGRQQYLLVVHFWKIVLLIIGTILWISNDIL